MRLFAAVTLLSLVAFWSYPFLAPELEGFLRAKVTPAPRGGEPVLVLAPTDTHVQPAETMAASLTESSEDPRR
jgi:hypothetical protein